MTAVIFQDIPTERDVIEIIEYTRAKEFERYNNFVLKLGEHTIFTVQKGKEVYYLIHESSFIEAQSNYSLGSFATYALMVEGIKTFLRTELKHYEAEVERYKRILK